MHLIHVLLIQVIHEDSIEKKMMIFFTKKNQFLKFIHSLNYYQYDFVQVLDQLIHVQVVEILLDHIEDLL